MTKILDRIIDIDLPVGGGDDDGWVDIFKVAELMGIMHILNLTEVSVSEQDFMAKFYQSVFDLDHIIFGAALCTTVFSPIESLRDEIRPPTDIVYINPNQEGCDVYLNVKDINAHLMWEKPEIGTSKTNQFSENTYSGLEEWKTENLKAKTKSELLAQGLGPGFPHDKVRFGEALAGAILKGYKIGWMMPFKIRKPLSNDLAP